MSSRGRKRVNPVGSCKMETEGMRGQRRCFCCWNSKHGHSRYRRSGGRRAQVWWRMSSVSVLGEETEAGDLCELVASLV